MACRSFRNPSGWSATFHSRFRRLHHSRLAAGCMYRCDTRFPRTQSSRRSACRHFRKRCSCWRRCECRSHTQWRGFRRNLHSPCCRCIALPHKTNSRRKRCRTHRSCSGPSACSYTRHRSRSRPHPGPSHTGDRARRTRTLRSHKHSKRSSKCGRRIRSCRSQCGDRDSPRHCSSSCHRCTVRGPPRRCNRRFLHHTRRRRSIRRVDCTPPDILRNEIRCSRSRSRTRPNRRTESQVDCHPARSRSFQTDIPRAASRGPHSSSRRNHRRRSYRARSRPGNGSCPYHRNRCSAEGSRPYRDRFRRSSDPDRSSVRRHHRNDRERRDRHRGESRHSRRRLRRAQRTHRDPNHRLGRSRRLPTDPRRLRCHSGRRPPDGWPHRSRCNHSQCACTARTDPRLRRLASHPGRGRLPYSRGRRR